MVSSISRRGFLKAGAAAACVPAIQSLSASAISQAAKRLPALRLGVASYSFHQFDRAHVIDFMHQLDCRFLNAKDAKDHLPIAPPEATDAALAAYQSAHIELTGAGVLYFLKPDEADVQDKFDYAKRAGVRLMVASPTHEALPIVEKFARLYDMRVAIHNHGPEDKEWPSPLDVLKVIEPMDKRIGLCMDMGHSARAFDGSATELIQAIHTCGPRLYDVHMKDLADLKVKESQVAVGEGKMPVREIFEALHEISYPGYVDLEYEIHDDDPLPGMKTSFATMRKVLKEMGQMG